MNEIIDLINKRASVRKFNDKPIANEIMDLIVNSAMRAPTAGNMMMYSIIKVKDKEILEALSKSCDNQPFIKDSDTALIFVVDLSKWHRYFLLNGVKEFAESTNRLYDGPTIADFMLGVNDAMAAAQNAVIAAESFGIGNCYIGDIMENVEYHRELLNLPKYVFPAAMLVFGYTDQYPKARERFDKKYVVFDNVYQELDDQDIGEMFSIKEKASHPSFENFAQAFYNRKIGTEFFTEMNRSIKVALKDWEN